jgi:hypothetical protein
MEWLVTVAENSTCSCGRTLRFTDHRLARDGDSYEIEATYVCDGCRASRTI